VLGYLPHSLQVHSHVVVDENVPHAAMRRQGMSGRRPRNSGEILFTASPMISSWRSPRLASATPAIEFSITDYDIAFDLPDGIEHMLQVQLVSSWLTADGFREDTLAKYGESARSVTTFHRAMYEISRSA